MRTSYKELLLILVLLTYLAWIPISYRANIIHVMAASDDVEFRIEEVFWGTLNNRITVSAGATNVPLTIVIRNYSNYTLRGVVGTLNLTYPFTDYQSGSNQSTARAQPIEQGNVLNQTGDILPMGSFSLTFYLNIDDNATKGGYVCSLKIEYAVKNGSIFIIGEPKILNITINIPNHPPTIESYSPSQTTVTASIGSIINFTIEASDQDNDNLTFRWELNGEQVANGTNYTFIAFENFTGTNTLRCVVDDGEATTTVTWTIVVQRISSTKLLVSTQYITAGIENTLNIRIRNDEWTGTVTASFNAPQPLVIIGNNTFTFRGIKPGDTISFNITLYAPETALGSTVQCAVSITYNDEEGNSYTENLGIGLIIKGIVVLSLYDIQVSPQPANPGDKVMITGVLLNRGNVKAQFVNVSLEENMVLKIFPGSFEYIGDLDPNSPTPFTLYAYVKSNASEGIYRLRIVVEYQDDIHEIHYYVKEVLIRILQEQKESHQQQSSGIELVDIGWGIIIVAAITAATIIYVRRKRGV